MPEADTFHPVLSAEAARFFRLLAVHPGPEFGVGAAAALAGASVRRARQLLDVLLDERLLEQTTHHRYALRGGLATRAEESDQEQAAALRRVLDWYLHTADAAQGLIEPAREHVMLDPPAEGIILPLSFADYDQAVDWAELEHPNFLPAVQAAERAGLHQHAWRLPAVLWGAKAPSTPITDWLAVGRVGLSAARRLGCRPAEANLLKCLGLGYRHSNQLDRAVECNEDALPIWRELGDEQGEAASLNALGLIHLSRRQLAEGEARFDQALALFRALGADHWETVTRCNLAVLLHQAGRLAEAEDDARRALSASREAGDKQGTGGALGAISAIHLDQGEPQQALLDAQEAVELALDLRHHVLEANWLLSLGNAQLVLGRCGDALISFQRSAVLHRRLGNRSREALAWNGAGETYHRLERDDEAAAFHRGAAAVHGELGDAWNEALTLDGLATALLGTRPDEAGLLRSQAMRLLSRYDDLRAVRTRERIQAQLG